MTLELLTELALLKEQNAQLAKERDAAVAEIEQNCYHCKHSVLYRYLGSDYNDCEFYKTGNCKCRDKWEWRGVQNADS